MRRDYSACYAGDYCKNHEGGKYGCRDFKTAALEKITHFLTLKYKILAVFSAALEYVVVERINALKALCGA